jgi:hypothetical protein
MAEELSSDQTRQQMLDSLPAGVGELFHLIWSEVVALNLNWKTFVELFGKSQERVAILNYCASSFFFRAQLLFWDDAFLRLSRLTDNPGNAKQENATLALLLNRLQPHLSPGSYSELSDHFQKIKEAVEKIRFRRNKAIAHSDLALLIGPRDALEEVTRTSVDHLIALVAQLINQIEGLYGLGGTSFHMTIEDGGAEDLVFWLEYAKRCEEKEREEALAGG